MSEELELLLQPLVDAWWQRFATKFERYYFSNQHIDIGVAIKFISLHFGLTREQVKQLAHYWREQGLLKITCRGWYLLKGSNAEEKEVFK